MLWAACCTGFFNLAFFNWVSLPGLHYKGLCPIYVDSDVSEGCRYLFLFKPLIL